MTTDAVDLIYVAAAAAAAAISPPDARSNLTAGDEAAAATPAAAVSSAVSSVSVREPLPLDDDGDVQFIPARSFNGAATPPSAAAASFIPSPFDRGEPSPLRACAARFAAAVGRSSSFGHPYTLHADQQDALVRAVEQRVAAETADGRARLSVSDAELVRSILLIVVTWPRYFAQVFKMMPRPSARKSSAAESTSKVSAAAAIHLNLHACPNSFLSLSLSLSLLPVYRTQRSAVHEQLELYEFIRDCGLRHANRIGTDVSAQTTELHQPHCSATLLLSSDIMC